MFRCHPNLSWHPSLKQCGKEVGNRAVDAECVPITFLAGFLIRSPCILANRSSCELFPPPFPISILPPRDYIERLGIVDSL